MQPGLNFLLEVCRLSILLSYLTPGSAVEPVVRNQVWVLDALAEHPDRDHSHLVHHVGFPMDVRRPYARKMEYLARVRDGSRRELADGHWCFQAVAVARGSTEMMPLSQELRSQETRGFASENEGILNSMARVSRVTQGRGVWAVDRNVDRRKILRVLMDQGDRSIVCQRGADI